MNGDNKSMTPINQFDPDTVTPPGDTLADVIEERGMSQSDLANRTGLTKKAISEIIAGKTAITADTASRLELVLDISSGFWTQLQENYQKYLDRKWGRLRT